MALVLSYFLLLSSLLSSVYGHAAFWHPSMWGFNVTDKDFPYPNTPVIPLQKRSFKDWWFHNHLAFPPNPSDTFSLPAGSSATAEISCSKSFTSFHNTSQHGDGRNPATPNHVCPGSEPIQYHAHNLSEVMGCALAIAYKSANNVEDVQPEDFTVFSVNHTCVWTRFTEFQVPKRMPPCPPGGCVCAFFWVHHENGGGSENYMNGFRCDVGGAEKNVDVRVAESRVPRRCGKDEKRGRFQADLGNCTYGAKTPFYWEQAERNNMFEGGHMPPVYNELYGFADGAQEDIFDDSYTTFPLPQPSPGAPIPQLRTVFNDAPAPAPVPSSSSVPAIPSSSPPSSSSVPSSFPSPSVPTDEPIFIPKGACKPRFNGLDASALSRRHDGHAEDDGSAEIPDCTSSGNQGEPETPVGLFGRRLYNRSRRWGST